MFITETKHRMKNAYIFALLFALFCTCLSAQPWVAKGTEWQFDWHALPPASNVPDDTLRCIDTVMHLGRMCSKLHFIGGSCSTMSHFDQYLYIENKRVYIAIDSAFHLYHDFNVKVGDTTFTTAKNHSGTLDSVLIKITDIDSTIYCGEVRKLFWFRNISATPQRLYVGEHLPIIEGVGFGYFFYPQIGVCDPSAGPLTCFRNSTCDTSLFVKCMSITDTKQVDDLEALRIYPNPGYDFLQVRHANQHSYQVFNALGQNVQKGLIASDDYTIQVEAITSGYYYLIFTNKNGGQLVRKWVKHE
jgi:Secretion system C-terminal sorting domain